MKVLGIMWEENSTAALVVDGRVVASVSEERFSRKKNDERYPKQAIEYVLKEGGLTGRDLDAVAFIGSMWGPDYILTRRYSTFSITDHVREQKEYWYPIFYEKKKPSYLSVFKEKIDLKQYPGPRAWKRVIDFLQKSHASGRAHDTKTVHFFQEFRRGVVSKHLGIPPEKIHFIDHSTGHAAYAYFGSHAEEALVLTADAWGDNVNASVSIARKGHLTRLASSPNFTVAHLYRYMTLLLGMKPNEHEYKVMGLAPYAKKKYIDPILTIFQNIQRVQGLGFKYVTELPDRYFYFKDKFEGFRFDAIAGGLQEYTEEMLTTWVRNALKKTKARTICFAGGVAMNVKANLLIQALPGVKALYVNPTPDDASQAIGAAFAFLQEHYEKEEQNQRKSIKPIQDAYLGPDLDVENLSKLLKEKHIRARYRVRENVSPKDIARLLVAGKVIGRAAGRSEFGARALGNRSIIADPRNPDIIPLINEKIKSRDFWMPFAASILERRAKDYLVGFKGEAPWMTIGFETTPRAWEDLRAGLHPADRTCRPQVIKKGQNPGYEAIITAFEKETGVGGVLNTSFNLHGEPIVQTIQDAWRVFELSGLDALLLGDTLIEKK